MNAFCIDCELFNNIEMCDLEVEPFDEACVCFVPKTSSNSDDDES